MIHGINHFPEDIKEMLLRIDKLGRSDTRWPLGENWPFGLREFNWAEGKNLDEARRLLQHYTSMLEAGRGDEVMVDPITQRPFESA